MDHVDLGLLVLRAVFGLFLAAHGWNKFFGPNGLSGTSRWFAGIGMRHPTLQARAAATTEVVAGVSFALGLLTPLAAAGIIGVMVVAWYSEHRTRGFFVFRPGQGWEYVASIAAAAFAVGTIGAGDVSIDHALGLDVDGWWGAVIAGGLGVTAAVLQLALFYRPVPAET